MDEQDPPSFVEPDHIFIRENTDPRMSSLEFAACKSLFNIIKYFIRFPEALAQKDVDTFCLVLFHIRPQRRAMLAISNVIFRGIVVQITMAQFFAGEQSSFQVIFDLIYGAINYKSKPPPLTKEDVLWGLIFAYYSPQVRPHQDGHPPFNLHFHFFVSSLYALDVIDDPVFCVCAMRDALETSWDNAQQYDRLLNSVGHWIISGGFKIIWQIKNGYEAVAPQTTLEHGELYELELDNTYGDCHPAPGLTMHRWQFWQQRIKDTMIFLVECERRPELRGSENIARQISAHMDILAGQPNS